VAEINSATGEQSRGIDQINVAVAQMNTVTQSAAANSEEAAAASEELSAQAAELNVMVETLSGIVYGQRDTNSLAVVGSRAGTGTNGSQRPRPLALGGPPQRRMSDR
jgi:methyl-accepting chemotaxis protein